MNKKIILAIAVLLIVAGGGAFYMTQNSPSPVNKTSPDVTGESETMQGTLKSLLTLGKSQQCTYSSKTDDMSLEGTVYVADGKMRGDYKSESKDIVVNGHVIVDSTFSYVWTDNSNQGFKVPLPTGEPGSDSSTDGQLDQANAPDLNESFDYSCKGWNKDNSLFTPPPSVNFQTFTIPTLPASNSNTPDCSICDNIPAGEARDACKTQLKCE